MAERTWRMRGQARDGGPERRQECLRFDAERPLTGVDHVEASAQGFGIDDVDRDELPPSDLSGDGQVGEKRQSESPLHHTLRGLNGIDLENNVRDGPWLSVQSLDPRSKKIKG